DAGWTTVPRRTSTWTDTADAAFPVKRTIRLAAHLAHLETSVAGDATGYVVYDGGPNHTIVDGAASTRDCVVVRHSHVVLRNLTIVNCGFNGVCVTASASPDCRAAARGTSVSDVVVERVDVSRFSGPEFQAGF